MSATRRRFLQTGAVGAAVLAVGGLGLALQPTRTRAPGGPLEVLTEQEHGILAAVAEALIPPRDGLPSPDEIGVARKIDALLARLHPGTAAEVKQALGLLENALPGLFLDGRIRPLSRLDREARAQVLEGWRTSRLPLKRTVFRAVAGLVGATYWGDPRTHAFVGYPGPPAWILAMRDALPDPGGLDGR